MLPKTITTRAGNAKTVATKDVEPITTGIDQLSVLRQGLEQNETAYIHPPPVSS